MSTSRRPSAKNEGTVNTMLTDARLGVTRLEEYERPGKAPLRKDGPARVRGKGWGSTKLKIVDITISPHGAVSVNLVEPSGLRRTGAFYSYRPEHVTAARGWN